jgi:hypothetical protein
MDHPSPGKQSLQYLGFVPTIDDMFQFTCEALAPHSQQFGVTRQPCEGTRSITRDSVQLIDGSCSSTILPPEKSVMITENFLFLGYWYMSSFAEYLGPFTTTRNQSDWLISSMATGVAAMLWPGQG